MTRNIKDITNKIISYKRFPWQEIYDLMEYNYQLSGVSVISIINSSLNTHVHSMFGGLFWNTKHVASDWTFPLKCGMSTADILKPKYDLCRDPLSAVTESPDDSLYLWCVNKIWQLWNDHNRNKSSNSLSLTLFSICPGNRPPSCWYELQVTDIYTIHNSQTMTLHFHIRGT